MVTAHLSRSGVLTAFIKTPSEMYYIQPSEHLVSGPHPFQMIAYRRSDIRRSLDPKVMDFIVTPVEDVNTNASDSDAPYFQVCVWVWVCVCVVCVDGWCVCVCGIHANLLTHLVIFEHLVLCLLMHNAFG